MAESISSTDLAPLANSFISPEWPSLVLGSTPCRFRVASRFTSSVKDLGADLPDFFSMARTEALTKSSRAPDACKNNF